MGEYKMQKLIVWIMCFLAFVIVGCGKSEKEKCEKDSTKQWDAKEKKCVNKEVGNNTNDDNTNNTNSSTTVTQTTEPEYTITNFLIDDVTVTSGEWSVELASANLISADDDATRFIRVPESTGAGCVKVKKPHFTTMKIIKKSTSETVCDNNNDNVFDNCKVSHLKLKEVPALPSGTVPRAVESLVDENCIKILINQ